MKGFTLIELMISMLLGLFVISTVSATFLRSNQTTKLNHQLGLMQESARIAMNQIAKDARLAGYTGCDRSAEMANALEATSSTDSWAESEQPVQGLDQTDTTNIIDSQATSESLLVFKLDSDTTFQITNHQTGSATLTLDNNVGSVFSAGDAAGISKQDCSQTALIGLTSISGNNATHGSGGGGTFKNCATQLQGSFRCYDGSTPTGTENFNPGFLKPLKSVAYFVRIDDDIPALFRKEAGNNTPVAIVDGIEQFRIYYGLDKDSDGIANRFIRASDLSFQNADWHNVTSLRIHLVSRSEVELTPTPRSYFFDGVTTTTTDLFLRREYVMTIALRNQG